MMPVRIQRSRAKGWKKPPGSIYCGRPSLLGNPFVVSDEQGYVILDDRTMFQLDGPLSPAGAVFMYRLIRFPWSLDSHQTAMAREFLRWIGGEKLPPQRSFERCVVEHLRGHDLLCWCSLDQPCHADWLLEAANGDRPA